MGASSNADNGSFPVSSTVASILGIKGPLRFRPHKSSQKAHVILRRVELSDDSSDDGEVDNVVCFSLFAHKRIEVKPGKELLLTVASSDERFKDRALMFEANPSSSAETSDAEEDVEEDTHVAEEEPAYEPPIPIVVPPKMRRAAWTKKEVSPVARESLSPSCSAHARTTAFT